MKEILVLTVWITALSLLCASCDNGLDIQQAYTFSLETILIQKRISVGEIVETRCTLMQKGRYDGARYTIRHFQPGRRGELKTGGGTVFLPNDRYPLDREVFRLCYTPRSDDQQAIDVCAGDNTGQVMKTFFTFRSEDGTEGTERQWNTFSQEKRPSSGCFP